MLPKPSQRFPGWQPCAQVVSGGTLPLQMPFCRGWVGGHGQGLLQCSESVASATIRFFPLHTSLMAMLHFSKEELKKAFLKFSQISRSNSGPTQIKKDFLLYAIYAVECGLKYLFLRNRGIHTTKRLAEYDDSTSIKTHDLNSLLRKVKIREKLPKFRRINSCHKDVSSEKLHELYRYGGKLDPACEAGLMKGLSKIVYEIYNNLGR